jgi:hypothetical protein
MLGSAQCGGQKRRDMFSDTSKQIKYVDQKYSPLDITQRGANKMQEHGEAAIVLLHKYFALQTKQEMMRLSVPPPVKHS